MTHVPRVTIVHHKNGRVTVFLPDGRKACTKCRRRPRVPGQRWCQPCRNEYNWQQRQDKVQVLLTVEERAMVLHWRAMRDVCQCSESEDRT